jgi:Co/Zn/Cd efflux system component
MKTATFRLARMDCSADEQLVRMCLDSIDGISAVSVSLDDRTVSIRHDTENALIRATLESLNLGTTQLHDETDAGSSASTDITAERRVLVIALVINVTLFVAELAAGLVSRSMGLLADSLDMLADAGVYGLSLVAVGGSLQRKKRLASVSGYLQFGLAAVGLIEVARRFLTNDTLPDVRTMILVSLVALGGNIATLLVLRRAKNPEAHFQASWIFTANDIKVNGLVIASAVIVAITDNPMADLLAGAGIFVIVANGARRILILAR